MTFCIGAYKSNVLLAIVPLYLQQDWLTKRIENGFSQAMVLAVLLQNPEPHLSESSPFLPLRALDAALFFCRLPLQDVYALVASLLDFTEVPTRQFIDFVEVRIYNIRGGQT